MASVFSTGNGILQQDSVLCLKTRIVLEGFEEHKEEFQLISWPPNLMDLNLMRHIWDFIVRHLRDQISSSWNISALSDHCLENGTTCLQSSIKSFRYPCHGKLQLF
ncbi:DDE_3 domain-containing protein [Trichonephila clavipes]|nr:DDE_3 domain-containing protein [Trichonephila clavipes]